MKAGLVRFTCLWLAFAGLLSGVAPALGDGCYMPERAFRKIPTIPAQRAVIAFKAGVETLIISSALDSESQKLGWIIPLPDVPERIEKESPGSLKTLDFCVQPRITHDPEPGLPTVLFFGFIANLLLAVLIFRRHRFMELLVVIAVWGILFGMLLPAMSAARSVISRGPTTLRLEKSVRVGAYDISVLSSKKAGDLDAWLVENDFASLPPEAGRTIEDYIRKGWVFATIKLAREESGANAPHPIKMIFNSKEMVYPLKLTAVAGGSTMFEIFAIADGKVSCGPLAEEFCDKFEKKTDSESYRGDGYEATESCSGTETGIKVAHPAVCKLMWDGCILTKFSGTISADRMTEDLHFIEKPFRAYRMHLYTRTGAREVALMLMVGLMGLILFVSMIVFAGRISQPQGQAWYFGKVLLPSLALSGLCALVFFVAVPKLPPAEVQVSRGFRHRMHPQMLSRAIQAIFAEKDGLASKTQEQIADYLMANVFDGRYRTREDGSNVVNKVTGDTLRVEDSPGNFTVEKGTTNIAIRIYDQTGRPLICNFPVAETNSVSN